MADPSESNSSETQQPTASSSSQQRPEEETCAHCAKPDQPPSSSTGKPLKPCLKCHSVSYCSKDCQKAHFKTHKKVCAGLAQEYNKTHEPKMASRAPARSGERERGLQKWQFDT
ncbi:uncharacterized protein K460DRAFT_404099 [Cucurbitaria berberidis CBS 394.84]|uniref:MYND-type domain-containing protein n=1 Tax=Cucurbitaria berberidis CBS 394.84 TaxID=1168544 RepID=A0A9P4GLZ7_9PLEO|nr:uncharacterized protein K460DRAFT_404099 [Cucurbitaria berberidis CBS 394.84]KAF1848833.1 hypothetical protein K460DRAFT_404099 [Cucurbitaria berberidis CBS 394.84]